MNMHSNRYTNPKQSVVWHYVKWQDSISQHCFQKYHVFSVILNLIIYKNVLILITINISKHCQLPADLRNGFYFNYDQDYTGHIQEKVVLFIAQNKLIRFVLYVWYMLDVVFILSIFIAVESSADLMTKHTILYLLT